ncbi:MAG: CRISPR system precrRNA processing endoribonuclease RAMP protein Cas6 [Phascolarctobacterium sp.]|uniref:CRISPR system precrRNA processing endoribonuclease RAMP protein Cas6 n=1 Tax=Phascolarctobacterium sp. TaxID=2049039 RepID=UPI0026DC2D90|nr:CRISPR system precrRNA processing endoribonuclease RAMP protein Cas6 [Phascolarctobacterium sp.]MDO4921633.1 CRISPR system precrRNA processing endoribonuclease RAMP protein Cas6 [Phascolarctobacterium sp.]
MPQSTGSLLHGVLMERVDKAFAALMHEQQLRPYSQYLYFDKQNNTLLWRLASLSEQAKQELLNVAFEMPANIYLKHKNIDVQVLGKEWLPAVDYDSLAEKYFAQDFPEKYIELKILSSCSFKSNGEYVIFPQNNLLFGSLIRKWNCFADNNKLDEQGLAFDLSQQAFVAGYRLSLQTFALEGIRIPAFRGTYTLGLKNNLMVNRIIAMLCAYAEYSGIGIKTALGMGGVQVRMLRRRNE